MRIRNHLTCKELEEGLAAAKTEAARLRYQVVLNACLGMSGKRIAEEVGRSRAWISTIIAKYNKAGAGYLDGSPVIRRGMLNDAQVKELAEAIRNPPADKGSWNARRAAEWMSQRLGKKVRSNNALYYLNKARALVPADEHYKTDERDGTRAGSPRIVYELKFSPRRAATLAQWYEEDPEDFVERALEGAAAAICSATAETGSGGAVVIMVREDESLGALFSARIKGGPSDPELTALVNRAARRGLP